MGILSLLILTITVVCLKGNLIPDDHLRATTVEKNTAACQAWSKAEPNPLVFLEQTRKCPCRVPATFPQQVSDGTYLYKGAYGCYRFAYKSKGPGAQCCYDKAGNWMDDPFQGAGTLDRERAPDFILDLVQWNAHNKHDVVPWNNCCKEPGMPRDICKLYFDKRPSGECQNYNM
ncbi:hypothetical protein I4U23_004429 [Adineta vaga]|nr:hypothetical protein I4U23_004429 [Adineta vaga]